MALAERVGIYAEKFISRQEPSQSRSAASTDRNNAYSLIYWGSSSKFVLSRQVDAYASALMHCLLPFVDRYKRSLSFLDKNGRQLDRHRRCKRRMVRVTFELEVGRLDFFKPLRLIFASDRIVGDAVRKYEFR